MVVWCARQERNERRRMAYRAKKTAATSSLPCQDEQAADGTRKRKGKLIVPDQVVVWCARQERNERRRMAYRAEKAAATSSLPCQDEQAADGTRKRKGKLIVPDQPKNPRTDEHKEDSIHGIDGNLPPLPTLPRCPRLARQIAHIQGVQHEIPVAEIFSSLKSSLTVVQNMAEEQTAVVRERHCIRHRAAMEKQNLPSTSAAHNRVAELRRNRMERYIRSVERRRSPRIADARILREKLDRENGRANQMMSCDGLIDVPLTYVTSELGGNFPPLPTLPRCPRLARQIALIQGVQHEIPVAEIFSSLKSSLTIVQNMAEEQTDVVRERHCIRHRAAMEKQNLPSTSAAHNRVAELRRNQMERYIRSVERRRSPRIADARILREKLDRENGRANQMMSCDGLGNLFAASLATACSGIARLPLSSETNELDNLFDVQLTYASNIPDPLSNVARKRRYHPSPTMEQISVKRALGTLRMRRLRRTHQIAQSTTDTDGRLSNAEMFRKGIQELEWGWCVECTTRFPDILAKGLCDFCKVDKEKHPEGSLYSAANEMDPGKVPEELSRLTDLEKLLIARVHPVMSVYRVKGQQYKYGGNVINFVQDVNAIATVLPHKPKDLSAILIVKRTCSKATKEFVVRREFVRQALVWLKDNHIYYQENLDISNDIIDDLPEDGVPDDLPHMNETGDQQGNETEDDDYNGPPELREQVLHIDDLQTVGTIGASIQPDHQRCIRQALKMAETYKTIAELLFTGEVIDEFTREGYITMAFPTLFPYGRADLRQSRLRKVTECQYFQHLMKYDDGRFARDSRFRYFAWNSITRWRALSLGSVHIKNHPSDGELSIESIRDMVSSGDSRLVARVSYYANQLRGTRAYWYTKLKELIAMVKQLGPPAIFFTFSAADLQWPELYALLDPDNILKTLNPMERRREKGRLLNENPLVVSWFFQKRVHIFFKEFLKEKFPVVDHWYRFEWQNRGSGHVHGFLWLRDRPDVSFITIDEQVRHLICVYFDNLVCTMNPDPTFSIDIQDHPCAKEVPLDNDEADYASLVNCVMRHTRCGSYCLRINKRTKQRGCRFKFPFEILLESKLVEEPPSSNMYRFVGRRNDPLVNSHNRAVLQTWRANIDWSAVTTTESVTQYIAKYAAKSEPASKNFTDTLRGIIDNQQRPCRDSTSVIKRLLIKNASERDISAQEVCHLLMGWHLQESSRKFVVLNLSESSLFSSRLRKSQNGDDGVHQVTNPSFFGRYLQRPDEFQNTSLIEMAKKHYYDHGKWRKYKVEAVVRMLPEFVGKIMPNTDQWESFCRQQVLLNGCYTSVEEAKGGFQTWSECYAELSRATENEPVDLDMLEDEFEDECDPENETQEEWMLAAGMAPNFGPVEDIDLGLRSFDVNYDWSQGLKHFPSIEDYRRFTHTLAQTTQEEHSTIGPDVSLTFLSNQQQGALDLVLKSLREGSTIRLIISGGAGTGKSTLINAIVRSTREMFGNNKVVRIMAPTGVAAFNIGGATIHHELAITTDKNQTYKKLETERCGRMQVDFKDTKLIVIAEYSMIGRKMLANIDLRCRDIFAINEPFGNISIVLVGDIRQLLPVFDTPLYAKRGQGLQLIGFFSYSVFEHCVCLKEVFRQAGVEESLFREALLRLSDGRSTIEDWKLFKTRDYSRLKDEEKNNFNHALRLFPTKYDAASYNRQRLKELGFPVASITSKNNCATAKQANSDEAKGLEDVVLLSKRARVMLRKNISTHYGLVNGSTGTVVDIVYAKGEKSSEDMPVAVMVEFDKYIGPNLDEGLNVIPITPITTSWISTSGVTCQRTQLPLILCWAITVHKSQGLTLAQAVVDIGSRESLGLTFVALSWTRRLRDLVFCPMFNFERIRKIGDCNGLPSRRQEEKRLEQLSSATL